MSEKSDIKVIMGANIANARKQKGLSQEKFAELISISLSTLSKIETGKSMPKQETLAKIIQNLNVELYELFLETNIKPKIKPQKNSYEVLLNLLENNKNDSAFNEALYKYALLLKKCK